MDDFRKAYGKDVESNFNQQILDSLAAFNFSPLRIKSPTLLIQKDGFTVYTGITEYAPPLNHFVNIFSKDIDPSKAIRKVEQADRETCASICLKSMPELSKQQASCLSFKSTFDNDQKKYLCYLFNFSLPTQDGASMSGTSYDYFTSKMIYHRAWEHYIE